MRGISGRLLVVAVAILALALAERPSAADELGKVPDARRVALQGYDPVSYFTRGKPEKGAAEFKATFDDAEYWFKDGGQRDAFVADPDRYAPQYGGFCTMTVSRGGMTEPDPHAWTILDGKLYVFRRHDGATTFRQQPAAVIEKADHSWPAIRHPLGKRGGS